MLEFVVRLDSLDRDKRREVFAEATRVIHGDEPGLELVQEVVIYGIAKHVTLELRVHDRRLAAEVTLAR